MMHILNIFGRQIAETYYHDKIMIGFLFVHDVSHILKETRKIVSECSRSNKVIKYFPLRETKNNRMKDADESLHLDLNSNQKGQVHCTQTLALEKLIPSMVFN